MRIYFILLANVLFVGASVGLVGPFLISAPSDIAVGGGIAYLFVVMPLVLHYFNKWFPLIKPVLVTPEAPAVTTDGDVK